MNKQNQQNPPSKKSKRVDSKGNSFLKFAAKDHGTTMPIVSHLTENECKILENIIREFVNQTQGKIEVTFVNFR